MEEQLTIQEDFQEAPPQEDPREKLWKGLNADGKYTKSFEEFKKKYSTKESIDVLYSGLSTDGDYTKSKDEFYGQYFSDLKKKPSSTPSIVSSIGAKIGGEAGTSNGSSPQSEKQRLTDFIYNLKTPEQKAQSKPTTKPIVASSKPFKKDEKPFDQTKEEAFNQLSEKITNVYNEEDPIGFIEEKSKKGSTNDAMQYQIAKNQLSEDLGSVDAARRWLFREGKEFNPENKTDVTAKARLDNYEGIKNIITQNGGDFAKSAFDYFAQSDEGLSNIKKEGGLPPPEKQGELVYQFLQDEDVKHLASESQEFHNLYKEQEFNLKQNHPAMWNNILAQKIAQGREDYGYNNPFLNLTGANSSDKVIDNLLMRGEIDEFDKKQYEKSLRPLIKIGAVRIPTTGIIENTLQSAVKGLEDIPKGIYDLTGLHNLITTKGERAYDDFAEEGSAIAVQPKGVVNKVSHATGNLAGVLLPIAGGGKLIKGMNLLKSEKAINELMLGVAFYHDIYKEAEKENPNGGYLNQIQAVLQSAVFAKINPALGMMSKNIIKDATPEIKDILKKLQSETISGEAAKKEITKSIVSRIGEKGFEIGNKSLNTSTQMALAGVVNDVIGGVFTGKFDLDKTAHEAAGTFESMMLGTPLLNMLHVAGNRDMTSEMLKEISNNPEYFRGQIEKASKEDPAFAKLAPQLLKNLDHVTSVKAELDAKGDLTDKQKNDFLVTELHKKVLEDKVKESPSKLLNTKEEKQLAGIEIEQKKIVDPEMGNQKFVEEFYMEDLLPKGSNMLLEDADGNFSPNKVGEYLKFIAQQANNLDENWKPHEGKAPSMSEIPDAIIETANERWAKEIDAAKVEDKGHMKFGEETVEQETKIEQPTVSSAVIEIGGKLYEGKNHAEAILKAKADGQDISRVNRQAQGKFKLSDGTIIDRAEAKKRFGQDRSELMIEQDAAADQANKDYRKITDPNLPTVSETEGAGSSGVEGKSDADIEKRMAEIEGDREMQDEFNSLEKEMEKRERASVFGVPLEKVNDAVDVLVKKEKDKPNGFGSFIETSDARKTKEVADKYSNAEEITDAELRKDFKDAVMGNPDTWYADGLKLRESMKEASNRGIDTKELIAEVEKEFVKDGYTPEDAKTTVAIKLSSIFKDSQKVNEKQLPTPKAEDKAPVTKPEGKSDVVVDKASNVGGDLGNDVFEYRNKKSPLNGQQYEVADVSDKGTVTLKPIGGKTSKEIKLSKSVFDKASKDGYYKKVTTDASVSEFTHYTKKENVSSISEKGFIPSETGELGKGVYVTNISRDKMDKVYKDSEGISIKVKGKLLHIDDNVNLPLSIYQKMFGDKNGLEYYNSLSTENKVSRNFLADKVKEQGYVGIELSKGVSNKNTVIFDPKAIEQSPSKQESGGKAPVTKSEGKSDVVGNQQKVETKRVEKVAELEAERDMAILREKVPEMKSVKEVVPSVEEVSAGSVSSEALLVNKKKRQELKNKYSELKKLFECLTKS